jgi:hypothetical protein
LPLRNNFPADFYENFAGLLIECSRLEYLLKLCVKDLMAEGFLEGMIQSETLRQFQRIIERCKTLAAEKLLKDQAREFIALVKQVERLIEYRHDTVHAVWTTDVAGDPLRIRPVLRKGAHEIDWSRSSVVSTTELAYQKAQAKAMYLALDALRRKWRS